MQLLNVILFWIFFGLVTSYFAKKRGRHALGWFFIGLFLGVIGIALLFVFPKIVKNSQQSVNLPPRPSPPKRSESWLKMWYYLDPTHAQQGPFEFPDLIKRWKEKGLSETSYIWGEGMGEWKRISELPDLIKEIEQA